jgi:adenylate cyclase
MESYYRRDFDEAIGYFQNVQKIFPDDYASQLMIDRCRQFKVSPPPENWDGVEIMTEK